MTKTIILLAAVLSIWPMGGKKFQMTADRSVPAATGTVTVKWNAKNQNTSVEVKVDHLADPQSLTPPEHIYVVWVQPRDQQAQKEGALGVGQDRKGDVKGVTTAKDFDVFVTAEKSETVTAPSGKRLLQTHVS